MVSEEELPTDNALAEGGDEAGALREVPHPGHVVLPKRIEEWYRKCRLCKFIFVKGWLNCVDQRVLNDL